MLIENVVMQNREVTTDWSISPDWEEVLLAAQCGGDARPVAHPGDTGDHFAVERIGSGNYRRYAAYTE